MKYSIKFPSDYVKPVFPGLGVLTAALRSGEYPQGKNFLCEEKEGEGKFYCCAGVCSLLQERLKEDQFTPDGEELLDLSPDNPLSKFFILPNNVEVISNPEGNLDKENINYYIDFYALNDNGFSFAEIADIFEAIYKDDGGKLPQGHEL